MVLALLNKFESVLQYLFESAPIGRNGRPEPLDVVRQIEREIERNKKPWVQGRTCVAHKIVVHLYAPSQQALDEFESLFNSNDFRQHIEGFIEEKGYHLFDRIRIVIQCHAEWLPEFGRQGMYVEFSYPRTSSDPTELTFVMDPDESRVLGVNAPSGAPMIPAWIEVLNGRASAARIDIHRAEFHIGRGENVLNSQGDKIIRVNHLFFLPLGAGEPINHSVSRQHATIVFSGGVFHLADNNSQNGTSLERGRSTTILAKDPRESVELADGDIIHTGRARLRFHLGSPHA